MCELAVPDPRESEDKAHELTVRIIRAGRDSTEELADKPTGTTGIRSVRVDTTGNKAVISKRLRVLRGLSQGQTVNS